MYQKGKFERLAGEIDTDFASLKTQISLLEKDLAAQKQLILELQNAKSVLQDRIKKIEEQAIKYFEKHDSAEENQRDSYKRMLTDFFQLIRYVTDTLKNHRASAAFPRVNAFLQSYVLFGENIDSQSGKSFAQQREKCFEMFQEDNKRVFCNLDEEKWENSVKEIVNKIETFFTKYTHFHEQIRKMEGGDLSAIVIIPTQGETLNLEKMVTRTTDDVLSHPDNYEVKKVYSIGMKSEYISKVFRAEVQVIAKPKEKYIDDTEVNNEIVEKNNTVC